MPLLVCISVASVRLTYFFTYWIWATLKMTVTISWDSDMRWSNLSGGSRSGMINVHAKIQSVSRDADCTASTSWAIASSLGLHCCSISGSKAADGGPAWWSLFIMRGKGLSNWPEVEGVWIKVNSVQVWEPSSEDRDICVCEQVGDNKQKQYGFWIGLWKITYQLQNICLRANLRGGTISFLIWDIPRQYQFQTQLYQSFYRRLAS